jgi:hypothetical protein
MKLTLHSITRRLPAILAAGTTLFGVVASPAVAAILPAATAAKIVAAGAIWQAMTKAVTHPHNGEA